MGLVGRDCDGSADFTKEKAKLDATDACSEAGEVHIEVGYGENGKEAGDDEDVLVDGILDAEILV